MPLEILETHIDEYSTTEDSNSFVAARTQVLITPIKYAVETYHGFLKK